MGNYCCAEERKKEGEGIDNPPLPKKANKNNGTIQISPERFICDTDTCQICINGCV